MWYSPIDLSLWLTLTGLAIVIGGVYAATSGRQVADRMLARASKYPWVANDFIVDQWRSPYYSLVSAIQGMIFVCAGLGFILFVAIRPLLSTIKESQSPSFVVADYLFKLASVLLSSVVIFYILRSPLLKQAGRSTTALGVLAAFCCIGIAYSSLFSSLAYSGLIDNVGFIGVTIAIGTFIVTRRRKSVSVTQPRDKTKS